MFSCCFEEKKEVVKKSPPVITRYPMPRKPPKVITTEERKYGNRPICRFGANCRRKNIAHKAEFFHPCDGTRHGILPVCRYGLDCPKSKNRSADARHNVTFHHPSENDEKKDFLMDPIPTIYPPLNLASINMMPSAPPPPFNPTFCGPLAG